MAVKTLPHAERLRQLFKYDPETGVLIWNHRPRADFINAATLARFENLCVGKPAGTKQYKRRSYGKVPSAIVVKIDAIPFVAHRLIWTILHGDIPDGLQVDHKNGNPFDNRMNNLRLATHGQNRQNSKINSSSRVGFKGVTKMGRKFQATIQFNKTTLHLGTFNTPEEAAEAYRVAAEKYHGEFARTG